MKKFQHALTSALSLGFVFALLLSQSACLRLDGNLFNPNANPITEYKLDAYEGPRECASLPDSFDIDSSKISLFTIPVNADEKIYAVYLGDINRIATDTVILYCHGNKDHMDLYWNRAKLLANVGGKNRFGVLMMDYRGYGLSDGTPSEDNLYEDVDKCMLWLQQQGLSSDRLIMYGFSMGTAPASRLTAQPRTLTPMRLILEAPFASAEVMVQDAARLAMPADYFVNLKIDNAEQIKTVQQPFLWLHGVNDDFLSIVTHGEVVFANYQGSRSTAFRVANGGHSDVPDIMGYAAYIQALQAFILQ